MDQLTLFQPGGTDYAHLITTGTPGFSNLPTALYFKDGRIFVASSEYLNFKTYNILTFDGVMCGISFYAVVVVFNNPDF